MAERIRVLYVDDSPLDRDLVRDSLVHEGEGFDLVEAASRSEFEQLVDGGEYDIVISDFNILGFEGLQVLDAVGEHSPDTPVVIVTGTGSEEVAVEAMKRGAADYVIKSPSHIRRLPHTLHAVLERCRAERENARSIERHIERLEALHEISKAINASTGLDAVLMGILGHVVKQLGVDAACILLWNEDNSQLEFAAGHGFQSEAIRNAQLHLTEGYAGAASLERRVVHVPNLLEGDYAKQVDAQGLSPTAGVVEYFGALLTAGKKVKGVLEILNESALELDPEWVVFLEMLAEQAAIAIDTAQLVDALRKASAGTSA